MLNYAIYIPTVLMLGVVFQDYLHVVDTLNIPTPDPQYLMDLIRHRHWGESVLIVDA